MDAKLTLKLNKQVIDKAKKYAESHHRSLSRLIESYLKSLTEKESEGDDKDIEISSFVKSIQSGVKIPSDFDYKKEYGDHLEERYR